MKRPSKKKNQHDLSNQSAADDRNLIETEESVELSIEDKISLYWMENKGFILSCAFLLVLIIVGTNGLKMYSASNFKKQQTAYSEALDAGTLEDYASAYSGDKLSGFAALTAANQAYQDADFKKADALYDLAADNLQDNILLGRARLGQAFALLQEEASEKGLELLRNIVPDADLPASIRAEAAYNLAIHALENGEKESFESYVAQIESNDKSGQWQRRIASYNQFNR